MKEMFESIDYKNIDISEENIRANESIEAALDLGIRTILHHVPDEAQHEAIVDKIMSIFYMGKFRGCFEIKKHVDKLLINEK